MPKNKKVIVPPDRSAHTDNDEPSFHELVQQPGSLTPPVEAPETPPPSTEHPPSYSDTQTLDRQSIILKYARNHNHIPTQHKKPGLQNRELIRLKQGKIMPDREVDFHNHTLEQAFSKLKEFIHSSHQRQHRCVLIICGKGKHSQSNTPLLQPVIRTWLFESPWVLAYCFASPHHGGTGALYALLKLNKTKQHE